MAFPCDDRTDEDNTIFITWPFYRWKKQQQQQNWVCFFQNQLARTRLPSKDMFTELKQKWQKKKFLWKWDIFLPLLR